MSGPPTVCRFASIREVGIFQEYLGGVDVSDFKRYNLIYGFNGTGKTTLSRIFSSLENGKLNTYLPLDSQFKIELSRGESIEDSKNLDALKGRLLVFNTDFVDENLRWKEGLARPVFYLGKKQAELDNQLGSVEAKIKKITERRQAVGQDYSERERNLTLHKRNSARQIAEELGLGRKYDASRLDFDYTSSEQGNYQELGEDERAQLRSIIIQESPLPKISQLDDTGFDFVKRVQKIRVILKETLGSFVVENLRGHEAALKWIKEGTDYHIAKGLSECLFCGTVLTESRLALLQDFVNSSFEQIDREVSNEIHHMEQLSNRVKEIFAKIPSRNDISKNLQGEFDIYEGKFREILLSISKICADSKEFLQEKLMAANSFIDPMNLPHEHEALNIENLALGLLVSMNEVVRGHNASHDSFKNIQESARKKLKGHYLAADETIYRNCMKERDRAKSELDQLDKEYNTLAKQDEAIRSQMREHGPAADVINSLVHRYLGHSELEIIALDQGYRIQRAGRPLTGSLSEGEKTAIAFCYFLSTLEAEGRHLKDLTVVLDDPISSLDTRSLNYCVSTIKATLRNSAQLFILTHNINFMNEIKKWFNSKSKEDKSCIIFIKTEFSELNNSRSSCLVKMLDIMLHYDSEYHYLFFLIADFSRVGGNKDNYYLMPNIMRKLLEIFLAFKLPYPTAITSKIEALADQGLKLDPARLRALDRLVQLESHADSLDDLVTFLSMTIEETEAAATALLELVRELDKSHYDHLYELCVKVGDGDLRRGGVSWR